MIKILNHHCYGTENYIIRSVKNINLFLTLCLWNMKFQSSVFKSAIRRSLSWIKQHPTVWVYEFDPWHFHFGNFYEWIMLRTGSIQTHKDHWVASWLWSSNMIKKVHIKKSWQIVILITIPLSSHLPDTFRKFGRLVQPPSEL